MRGIHNPGTPDEAKVRQAERSVVTGSSHARTMTSESMVADQAISGSRRRRDHFCLERVKQHLHPSARDAARNKDDPGAAVVAGPMRKPSRRMKHMLDAVNDRGPARALSNIDDAFEARTPHRNARPALPGTVSKQWRGAAHCERQHKPESQSHAAHACVRVRLQPRRAKPRSQASG